MATEQASETFIGAPRARVWELLADLSSLEDFDPNVLRSFYVTEDRAGVGAARQCDLPDDAWVRERVIAWDEGRGYEIEVYEGSSDFPLDDQRARFELEDRENGTLVRLTFRYTLVPDAGVTEQEAAAMGSELVASVVGGLKRFVETGERVDLPEQAAASG